MNRVLALLIFVAAVIAVPTPSKTTSKKAFAAKAKGHGKPAPAEAMKKAARKYGITLAKPNSDLEARHDGWGEPFAQESGAPSWEAALQSWAFEYSTVYLVSSASAAASWSASAPAAWSSAPTLLSSEIPIQSSSGSISSFASSSAPVSSAPVPSATSPPPSQSSAPSSGGSETGEVSADPEENETEYLSPVSIGGQTLNLDFDTGSSDLWVYSSLMSSSESAGHSIFDPSKSKTFTEYQGGSWQIQYGDGSTADGSVGFDKVVIGGAVVQKQCVELAKDVSPSFNEDPNNDGLLGLGFSSNNQVQPQQQKTFFENIMDDLEQPLFTADLEEDNSGTYEFGKIDSSKYQGDIHYTAVDNSQGWWGFDSPTFTVGGTEHSCSSCTNAILDTGTTLIMVDDVVVKAYYAQVQGAQFNSRNGGYMYPCSASLPDFGIAIGSDYTAVVKGSDMTYAEADGQCFGGLQSSQGAGVRIFGDVFLKQFFVVFDGGNMQVGVAEKP